MQAGVLKIPETSASGKYIEQFKSGSLAGQFKSQAHREHYCRYAQSQCCTAEHIMSLSAPISAAQAIGEYLQSPDDLLKIAAFRKKLEKEKASIDARLKSGVKEQLDATRVGLSKLLGTRNNVQVIKDEMQTVDRDCNDPQNVVSTFDQISRVSMPLIFYSPVALNIWLGFR